jgi:serine protease Do
MKLVRSLAAGLAVAVVAVSGLSAAPARAQPEGSSPEVAQDINVARSLSRAFRAVARTTEPSVVHITQLQRISNVQRNIFGVPIAVGEPVLRPAGLGSGAIVSEDGLILTNNHVVAQAEQLRVRLFDGREFPAKVLGRDPQTDIAVLRIEAKGLPALKFADSDQVEVGEWVVAIGSPFGYRNSVTSGIISARGRSGVSNNPEGYEDFLQTDAAINPGNSGGPLLNLDGEIVGINTAIATRAGGSEGIGFAIPANIARNVMNALIKNGRVTRGFLGVSFAPPEEDGSKIREGVKIASVADDGPAAGAGLKPGDVITRFNGRAVEQVDLLRTQIATTPPGTTVELEYLREGSRSKASIRLSDLGRATGEAFIDALGVTVRRMTNDLARQLGYRTARGLEGVAIVSMEPNGRALAAGLKPGDIIWGVNGARTRTPDELLKELKDADLVRGIEVNAIREGMRGSVVIRENANLGGE